MSAVRALGSARAARTAALALALTLGLAPAATPQDPGSESGAAPAATTHEGDEGGAPLAESTVGVPARLAELVLPGPELEARAADAASPLVVRVVAVSPHGTSFRYDLEVEGLEPGEYDLRQWLQRRDGVPLETGALPPLTLAVRSLLPPGRVRPHTPDAGSVPALGAYRALLVAGGVVWVAGLAWLLWAGRKRRALEVERVRPRTLAERLRPLVERARAGELSRAERAELELGLVAYWRRRLGLDGVRPEEALASLRAHAEAGPLLRSLEEWLHAPAAPEVDVARLLEPYRDLPADALEEPVHAAP